MGKLKQNLEYPYNLLKALGFKSLSLTQDRQRGINYVLSLLDEREFFIIQKRYVGKMTQSDIGLLLRLSSSQVGYIERKALRKMGEKKQYIAKGYSEYSKELALRVSRGAQLANTVVVPLEEAELSVRIYNCLCKHGIRYLNELTSYSSKDLSAIRNISPMSCREILGKLREYGMSLKR